MSIIEVVTIPEIIRDENTSVTLQVNDDGSINVISGLISASYDYIGATYPNSTTEVYTYKTGGASGTTVATVTVVYTTATKDLLSTVTKT